MVKLDCYDSDYVHRSGRLCYVAIYSDMCQDKLIRKQLFSDLLKFDATELIYEVVLLTKQISW